MQWQDVVAIIIGAFVVLSPALMTTLARGNEITEPVKHRKKMDILEKALPNLTCATDADCPPGFVCFEGRCIPQESP